MPTYTENNVNYSYTVGSPNASVTSSPNASGDIVFLDKFTVSDVTYNVTSIGVNAFQTRASLTSVVIPSSVISIAASAFSGCSGLTSITFPSSVTSIGDSAFQFCSGLTSITIPSRLTTAVTTIGNYAFSGCTSLTNIYVNTYLANFSSVFSGVNNDNLQITFDYEGEISANACNGRTKMTSVTIGPKITSIADYAFYNCTGLTSVTIPASVISIGNNAFQFCSKLTSVSIPIPSSLKTIGDNAFRSCAKLINMTIPDSVTSLGQIVFAFCYDLTSITIPSSIKSIAYGTFYSCSKLTNITIPDSVTIIGDLAFQFCSSLTSITLSNRLTAISAQMFNGCSVLTSITIPASVTSIGAFAFNSCSGLTSVSIPVYVISIGAFAFQYCSGLTSVTLPASFTTVGTTPFAGCYNITSINNVPISISWRSISVSQQNNSTPFFYGFFSTFDITNTTIINVFYNSSDLTTNISAHTNNDYNADFVLLNGNMFTSNGTTITSIPALDSQYGAKQWFFSGNNKMAYKNSANTWVDLPATFIFTINSITDPYSQLAVTVPAAPTELTASISGTTATINFNQPSNGSPAVTSYTYATSSDNVTYSSFVNTNLTKVSATQVTVSGLTNGSTYYFKLIANNGFSSSASSASNSVFVNFAPAAPTGLTATVSGTTATINFDQVTNGSAAVSSYTYATSSDNVSYSSFVNTNLIKISATQVSISGLTNGSTYYFKLMANNGIPSLQSSASNSVFVNFAPAAPTGLTATVSGTTATINFDQATNGSAVVTSYTYATSSDNVSYSSFVNTNLIKVSATQVTVSGLTNGSTYYFKLIANNGIPSAESSESNSVFVNFAPAAPTGLTSTISETTATINFDQPTNGSANVSSYTYATSSDNVTYSSFVNTNLTKVSATQVTVSGLTLGSTYYFKLIAYNGFSSVASGASNSLFVNCPQPAAVISTVSYNQGSLNVYFTQTINNGLPVTSYSYSVDNGQTYSETEVTTSPLEITGLKPRVQNRIIIKANNGLDSPDSNTFSFAYYNTVGKKPQ